MITPRRTRLLRVPSLRGMQDQLAGLISGLDLETATDTFVVVPTRAAGEQLRRSVEDRLLQTRAVMAWPNVGPRADLYRELASRATRTPLPLSEFDREVLLARVAREVRQAGLEPPFALRPSLVAEMVALYDHIRRQARTLEDFDRNLRAELEPSADTDRGAAQLLGQTAFLTAVFTAYERQLADLGASDEHRLREHLLAAASPRPLQHVVVAVADRVADADGLWPVDFALLAQLPRLARVDIVATEALLASGFLERVHAALPGLDEVLDAGSVSRTSTESAAPRLVVPATDVLVAIARDREEELALVARRLKAARHWAGRPRCATGADRAPPAALSLSGPLGVRRRRRSLRDARHPAPGRRAVRCRPGPGARRGRHELRRPATVGLLRSPHFTFDDVADGLPSESVSAFDRALADARYLGGIDRLARLAEGLERDRRTGQPRRTKAAARGAGGAGGACGGTRAGRAGRVAPGNDTDSHAPRLPRASSSRARAKAWMSEAPGVRRAVSGALAALGRAHAEHDPEALAGGLDLSSAIRRWLGGQTFAVRTGVGGSGCWTRRPPASPTSMKCSCRAGGRRVARTAGGASSIRRLCSACWIRHRPPRIRTSAKARRWLRRGRFRRPGRPGA